MYIIRKILRKRAYMRWPCWGHGFDARQPRSRHLPPKDTPASINDPIVYYMYNWTINLLRMSQDNSYYCIKPHYLLSWSHAISCHGATPSPIIAPRHILSMSHNISNHNKPHHLQSLTTSCSVIEPRHFLSFSLCHLLSLSHAIS